MCPTQLDETFCRVVYEAFQNKIPPIFSNCGNLGYINENNLLCIKEHKSELYNNQINKLINNKDYYNKIVEYQYNYYLTIKDKSNINIIENKLLEIEKIKINELEFYLGVTKDLEYNQEFIKHFEDLGYQVFIFPTKPYLNTNKSNLIGNKDDWVANNIYRSPNRRLDVSMLEFDLFVENYKIKSLIIPEIQYEKLFEIAQYLREKYKSKLMLYQILNVLETLN